MQTFFFFLMVILGTTYLVHTPNIIVFYENVYAQVLPSAADTSSVMIPFTLVFMQTVHMHTNPKMP